jgi:hypothetical protein
MTETTKTPRKASTYRGARRNAARANRTRFEPWYRPGAKMWTLRHPPVRENRSRHHEKRV